MAKSGTPLPGGAGLAEWLPLLGSICQTLAALGEEKAADTTDPEGASAAQSLRTSEERG